MNNMTLIQQQLDSLTQQLKAAESFHAVAIQQRRAAWEELALYRNPHPLSEWHEDDGCKLWWTFPVIEEPYMGSPLCSDWPGYHTHWTNIPLPIEDPPT